MNDTILQLAHIMARELIKQDCDPNEVQKAFTYLRLHPDGEQFFRFLNTLVQQGWLMVRSRRTLDYYRVLLEVCRQHLTPYRTNVEVMCQVLGWTVRLMRFYMAQQAETSFHLTSPHQQRRRWQR